MTETILPDIPPVTEDAQPEAPLSVSDKFIGVLSEPSPTFENIRRAGPRTSDWMVPLMVLTVIVMVGTFLKFSNETFKADMRQKAQEQMQQQVRDGKMTQEQADGAMDQIEKVAPFQQYLAVGGVLFTIPIVFFLMALIYWLLTKYAMKGTAAFAAVLSVYGLTAYIGAIDQVIAIILGYATGNPMATFSPALFMKADLGSRLYKFLMNMNPITIWSYFVFAIGLHKVAELSKARAYALVFGLWLLWIVALTFIHIPGMG
jgi:hypothetical protein